MDAYLVVKLTVGVFFTIGLYSVLYKENKFYRFCEHIFLGLASGYSLVAIWTTILYDQWWLKMTGVPAEGATKMVPGYFMYAVLLPIGLCGYMVLSKKNNWMSKIPIGVILGLWSGQQVKNWWTQYGAQIYGSMQPVIPTTFSSINKPALYTINEAGAKVALAPETAAVIRSNIYSTQALSNFIFIVTLVTALSYFLFNFELKGKFLKSFNTMGRWLLMIGFGALFGSTVMARFALVIDRMSFIWNEWLRLGG